MDGATHDPRQRAGTGAGVQLLSRRAAALSFDRFQRVRLVADLLDRLQGDGPPLEVLDLGGGARELGLFRAADRIVAADAEPAAGPERAGGRTLAFADGAFDAVVVCDRLPQVAPEERAGLLGECRRVARRWVIVSGPFDAPRVEQAQALLRRFVVDKLGREADAADVPARHGLPALGDVEDLLRDLGGEVATVGHGRVERWLAASCLARYMEADPALEPLLGDFQRFYNEHVYARDAGGESYRHAVVAAFDGAPRLDATALGDAPDEALDLAPALHVAQELACFDLTREVVELEREELCAANRALSAELEALRAGAAAGAAAGEAGRAEREAELEGLRESLALERAAHEETRRAFRAEPEAPVRQVAELERQLAEARASAPRPEELAAERARAAELARLLEERTGHLRKLAAALEGQLEERVADREELGRLLEALRAERAERAQHQASESALELDLASLQQLVADLGQQATVTERQLAQAREELEVLRAELDQRRSSAGRAEELEQQLRQAVVLSETLQMDLAGRDDELSRLRAQCDAAHIAADQLGRQLEAERETSDDLRRELGRRFANLRRAFTPKLPPEVEE